MKCFVGLVLGLLLLCVGLVAVLMAVAVAFKDHEVVGLEGQDE